MKQIKSMVEKVASEKILLINKQISDQYFGMFLKQQPQLQLHKGGRAAMVCLDAVKDREELVNYFIKKQRMIQIYNVDESGVPLDHRRLPYVLTKKGQVCFVQNQSTNNCSWVYQ